MTAEQFKDFEDFKTQFKAKIEEWNNMVPELQKLQKEAASAAKTPAYPFETPIVYNRALDEFTQEDEIKIIVIGDNPGKDEQLLKNNKYLVGQAGKLGEGFFRKNPELGVDFRKNAIILNKTPVHSAKTAQLKHMKKSGGKATEDLLEETQNWMAEKTAELAKSIGAEIWLVGYSELKGKGLFLKYRDRLEQKAKELGIWEKLFVFQHFSMNCFSKDLKKFREEHKSLPLKESLIQLGNLHKQEIFN